MSTQISNCHDAFFKRVLGEPELAGTFLREHLPADVAELLGPEPPEPVPVVTARARGEGENYGMVNSTFL
jgi:hypothetical protein